MKSSFRILTLFVFALFALGAKSVTPEIELLRKKVTAELLVSRVDETHVGDLMTSI